MTINRDIETEQGKMDVGITASHCDGWFEFYDIETGGEDYYAEGQLEIEDSVLVGYDGVFELPDFMLDILEQEMDIDVSEIR